MIKCRCWFMLLRWSFHLQTKRGWKDSQTDVLVSHILLWFRSQHIAFFFNASFYIIFYSLEFSDFVEQDSSKTELKVFYNLMAGVPFHHFCYILFVKSKSLDQLILKGKGLHKGMITMRWLSEDPLESSLTQTLISRSI